METLIKEKQHLETALGTSRIEENVLLAPLTTFRIGGPADLFFEAFKYAETAEKTANPIKSAKKSLIEQNRPGTKY